HESILNAAGIIMDEGSSESTDADIRSDSVVKEKPKSGSGYSNMTIAELEENLKTAIAEEAYEKASVIRDEINRRSKGKK
ncbi:MAG: hypothetical protein HGB12_14475, partial [Bacteroidetes bacterium]|nr:hypothetical protein [Bacteroidota bacterium]